MSTTMSASTEGCQLPQGVQDLYPSKHVANSEKNVLLYTLASLTEWGCHLTFTLCPCHYGLSGSELAEMAAKEGTTVEQEGENHHYDSAKAAMRQATMEPSITHECLRGIYGKRGERINNKLEGLQLSRKDQVSISRLRSSHHPDLKYWLHKTGWYVEETVEHAMGECPPIHHPANKLPEPYIIATNPLKALELWELWRVKSDLPGISQPGLLA